MGNMLSDRQTFPSLHLQPTFNFGNAHFLLFPPSWETDEQYKTINRPKPFADLLDLLTELALTFFHYHKVPNLYFIEQDKGDDCVF